MAETTEWMRICCPVDLSEAARAALEVAIDLSRRFGSELVLLHVDSMTKVAEELSGEKPIAQQLSEWRAEAQREGVRNVTIERVRGQPEVAIVDHAGRTGVDLVVMGTHGRTDRQGMLTGSVAEGVVRNVECPVLVIKAPRFV